MHIAIFSCACDQFHCEEGKEYFTGQKKNNTETIIQWLLLLKKKKKKKDSKLVNNC